MQYLRQNTVVVATMGPFIASSDGITTSEALTLVQANLQLSKNGAAAAQKSNVANATHLYAGTYGVDLDATDTNTAGTLRMMNKDPNILPIIVDFMVVPEIVYDAQILDTDKLQIDVVQVSGGSSAAANLAAQFDGSGLAGDNFPSTQLQIGNLGTGAGGLSTVMSTFTNTAGGPETNDETFTTQLDGNVHIVEDSAGSTDFNYEFSIGPNSTGTEFIWDGYVQSNGDSVTVLGFDWVSSSYKAIKQLQGGNGATVGEETFIITTAMTGTKANVGLVRCKFESSTATAIATDRILVEFTNFSESVGYDGGAVWIDGSSTNIGTIDFTDGVADNPTSNLTLARTIADSVGLKKFDILPGTNEILNQSFTSRVLEGVHYTIGLNSQNISGSTVTGASFISGTANCPVSATFFECGFGDVILDPCNALVCGFTSVFKMGTPGIFTFGECAGFDVIIPLPVFDFSGFGSSTLNLHGWADGIQVDNMVAGDTLNISGEGALTMNTNCTGGTVSIQGNFCFTNNGSGLTINQDARVDIPAINATVDTAIIDASLALASNVQVIDTNVDAILVDTSTTIPSQITSLANITANDVINQVMSESYAAANTEYTLGQALYVAVQRLGDFSISGTTITVNKIDGVATAVTYELDSATVPTSSSRT